MKIRSAQNLAFSASTWHSPVLLISTFSFRGLIHFHLFGIYLTFYIVLVGWLRDYGESGN